MWFKLIQVGMPGHGASCSIVGLFLRAAAELRLFGFALHANAAAIILQILTCCPTRAVFCTLSCKLFDNVPVDVFFGSSSVVKGVAAECVF